jgi:hypothetical protein
MLPAAWFECASHAQSLSPEAGVLVLRNGHILEGQITQAGDYFIVTLGESGEVRMKAADVEACCGSLDEAYDFKARHLSGRGVTPHLELAEWCLRHNLHARCAEQLVAAMRIEPEHPRLMQLERRLSLAARTPEPAAIESAPPAAALNTEQLDKAIGRLPAGSMEKFAAVVQPILLNRCGANSCHGPNAVSDFRLLRPPAGQVASRRFTQRNLYAALTHVDPTHPESSPLLTLPQRRHGTALTAVFDKHTQSQLAELMAWVKLSVVPPPAAAPSTIGPAAETLSQAATGEVGAVIATPPAALPPGRTKAQPIAPGAANASVRAMRPAMDEPMPATSSRSTSASGNGYVPRDRYDAEVFNRRFHK